QDGRSGDGRERALRRSGGGGRRSPARHQQARARALRHERRAGIQERPMSRLPCALCAGIFFALVTACPRQTEVKPTPQEEPPPPEPAPKPKPPPQKPPPKPPKVAQPTPEPPIVILED